MDNNTLISNSVYYRTCARNGFEDSMFEAEDKAMTFCPQAVLEV